MAAARASGHKTRRTGRLVRRLVFAALAEVADLVFRTSVLVDAGRWWSAFDGLATAQTAQRRPSNNRKGSFDVGQSGRSMLGPLSGQREVAANRCRGGKGRAIRDDDCEAAKGGENCARGRPGDRERPWLRMVGDGGVIELAVGPLQTEVVGVERRKCKRGVAGDNGNDRGRSGRTEPEQCGGYGDRPALDVVDCEANRAIAFWIMVKCGSLGTEPWSQVPLRSAVGSPVVSVGTGGPIDAGRPACGAASGRGMSHRPMSGRLAGWMR